MDGFDAALFQFVGTHAVDTFHHDIAHDDGRGRPGQGLETDLEAGILLQAGQVGGNDRNLLHTGLFQGPADKAHIVGSPAASACLGHDHGRLVQVVFAGIQRLHDLSDDEQGRIAGVVIDVFEAVIDGLAVIVAQDHEIVAHALHGRRQQVEMDR